ncbi:hypothetical protein BsWGS_17811 [Bradybaena similaris]
MIRILLKRKVVLLLLSVAAVAIIFGLDYLPTLREETVVLRKLNSGNDNRDATAVFNDRNSRPDVEITTTHRDFLQNNSGVSLPVLPGVYTYLPHLVGRPEWLTPRIQISKARSNVSIVIGIPSIRRPMSMYIFNTLESLFNGMNDTERNDALVILSIAEPWNETYVSEVLGQLSVRFPKEIKQGLLDAIVPRAEFYPELGSLKLTLGDSRERVKWRSKQNLDYAFLMLHSWSRGRYYLQLEDDIKAVPGYITSMKEAIAKTYWPWFSIEFSTLGFIGRLFKAEDTVKMVEFLLMFYSSKPCDWLYDDYLQVKMCGHGEKWSKCIHKIKQIARSIKPSLFQHEGFRSSLSGNINKLKDKAFGSPSPVIISNPPVESIITTLQTYSKYDIYSAYDGQDFFWGGNPKEGDLIDFLFDAPIKLSNVYIVTGNTEHPKDILRNSTLEILPFEMPKESSTIFKKKVQPKNTPQQRLAYEERLSGNPDLKKMSTNDTFFSVGEFDKTGIASFDIPEEAGKIWVLRIQIHAASETWVLIQNITLQVR